MSPQVQAIVLAAGSSSRMGRIKQLLPLPDRPAVRRCLESLFAGGISHVIVVVAPGSPVAAAVRDLPVRILCNDDPGSDMAGSVRAGLAAAEPGAAILVCPADHPLVAPGTIAAILQTGAASPGNIIMPTFQGRRGHPTLFPRTVIETIAAGGTLRDVITVHKDSVTTVEVGDEAVMLDMDSPQDYEKLLRKSGAA